MKFLAALGSVVRRHLRLLILLTLGGTLVLAGILAWMMFPQPIPGLWPPEKPDEKLWVDVCIDDFHSLVSFPDYQLGCFQEWHMGVATWYLEHRFATLDGFKSLVNPVPGSIKFGAFRLNFQNRESLPADKTWRFALSAKGMAAMQASLHRWRGKEVKFEKSYWHFESTRSWHPFRNCNAFVGAALRAAGLPVREAFSQEDHTMTWQLRRCKAFQDEWLAALPSGSIPLPFR